MEELIEKVEILKDVLSKEEVVLDLLKKKKIALGDDSLVQKIKEYKMYPREEIKKEIENSPSFLSYKEAETNVNLLILGLNQQFKKIQKEISCRR